MVQEPGLNRGLDHNSTSARSQSWQYCGLLQVNIWSAQAWHRHRQKAIVLSVCSTNLCFPSSCYVLHLEVGRLVIDLKSGQAEDDLIRWASCLNQQGSLLLEHKTSLVTFTSIFIKSPPSPRLVQPPTSAVNYNLLFSSSECLYHLFPSAQPNFLQVDSEFLQCLTWIIQTSIHRIGNSPPCQNIM